MPVPARAYTGLVDDVLGLQGRQPQPHQDWVSLSALEEKRLRELALFWARYTNGEQRPAETVLAALTGEDENESGIILTDEVLFDLQTLVATLPDLKAVVVDLHRQIYSGLLDDLRSLRGYARLDIFPSA